MLNKALIVSLLATTITACGGGGGSSSSDETPNGNQDTTAPVITLTGDSAMTLSRGANYTEQGATAVDDVDGTVSVNYSGNVDTATVGEYTISYTATDAAGNEVTVTRTITIADIVNTGVINDLVGVSYLTDSQSGTLAADGKYNYKDGETITFSLGDTVIGDTVAAKATMTPFDLVSDAVLYTTYSQVKRVIKDLQNGDSSERRVLNKFSNVLTFLHTLDEDANPDNGININAGTASLFEGVELDFETDLFEFDSYKNKKLTNITRQAFGQGLLSTAKIKAAGYSLDHFYSAQNISHNLAVRASVNDDDDANGVQDYSATYTYDAAGHLLTESIDQYGDGSPNKINTHSYDANGDKLTYNSDSNGDGNANESNTYTYNASRQKLTYSRDSDGDGDGTPYLYTYTYDATGNMVTNTTDTTNDGIANASTTYTYDDKHNVLNYTNKDGDGITVYIRTYTYDANGNQLTNSTDSNADGNPNSVSTYTYDENGNKLTTSEDYNGNGNPDRIYTESFDANGNQLLYSTDFDGDGSTDSAYIYTYNTNGNELTKSYEANDILSYIESKTYDANYNTLSERSENADGTLRQVTYNTYDASNNRLTETKYTTTDGDPDNINTYTYDANHNLLTKAYGPNDIYTYTYDANGNKLIESRDSNNDGSEDRITTYTVVSSTWLAVFNDLN